ncbi:unnamed protein product [Camellia sinensis]
MDGSSVVQQSSNQDPSSQQVPQSQQQQGASSATSFPTSRMGQVSFPPAAKKTPIGYQTGRHYATAGSATTTAATGIHAITNPQSSVASFNSVVENATTAGTVSAVYTTSAASPHTATVATTEAAAAVETTTSTGYATYTHTIAYWRKFVTEYYSPRAKKRWFLSLYDNVGHHSLGVFPQATMLLEKLGPLEWDKVVHGHEAWRLITCIWLHAGILGLNSQQRDSNSQLREMMQNPVFIRQLTSPETIMNVPGNPRDGAFIDEKQLMTLQQTLLSQLGRQPSTLEVGQTGRGTVLRIVVGTLDNMGLEMLMNMFGGLGIGSPAVPVRSDEMGFFDTRENIQALIATARNVHAAVERILGNPGLAEAAKAQFSRDYSDNLALVRAYEAWKEAERDVAGYEYCWKNFLFAQSMKTIDAL